MTKYATYTENEIKAGIELAKQCAVAAEKSGNMRIFYECRKAQIELEGELVNRRYDEYNRRYEECRRSINASDTDAAAQQSAVFQQQQFDSATAAHQAAVFQRQQFDSVVQQQNFDSAVQWQMDAANSAAMNCGMMF